MNRYIEIDRLTECIGDKDKKVQTLGVLRVYAEKGGNVLYECKTLELPWRNNMKDISCIPEGVYDFEVLNQSPSFTYQHVWIKNVPNRKFIKIHAGNSYTQILGCVLVGKKYGYLPGDDILDVIDSRKTMDEINKHLGDSKFGQVRVQNLFAEKAYLPNQEFSYVAVKSSQVLRELDAELTGQ